MALDHLPDVLSFWQICIAILENSTCKAELERIFLHPEYLTEKLLQTLREIISSAPMIGGVEHFADGRVSMLLYSQSNVPVAPVRVVFTPVWVSAFSVEYKIEYVVMEQLLHPIMDI